MPPRDSTDDFTSVQGNTGSAAKIPTTIVTGFLGAGKTSLIRHLLGTANGRRLALIINEFGDIGVDGDLLASCGDDSCTGDDIVELANGCICCTVANDFLPAIRALLERPEPPDHIIIETSGLALPKPLVRAFGWPEVRTRVTVDGVVAVIDSLAVAEGRFADDPEAVARQRAEDPGLDHNNPLEELFEDQLACADMVVLNKTDQLDADRLGAVTLSLAGSMRPGVKLVRAAFGAVDGRVLLGLDAGAEEDLAARPSHHDGAPDHNHDDYDSFSVDFGEVTDIAALTGRLAAVVAQHDILRIKGFVAVKAKNMRLVLQGVGGRFQHYFDREWNPGEKRVSRLVVIGHSGLDHEAVGKAIGWL